MAKKYQRRKRNYLINKDLQGKLGFRYLVITLVGGLLLAAVFAGTSADYLTISYDSDAIEVGSTPMVLFWEMARSGGIFLLVGGLLTIIITIVLTHKIAGPLYRFEQTLKAMGERKLNQRIYLRTGDEGQELGRLINDFNQTLIDDIHRIKEAADKLADGEEKKLLLKIADSYQLPEKTEITD